MMHSMCLRHISWTWFVSKEITHMYKIMCYDSNTSHFAVVLANGHVVCDCMMGINLGIPCRHIFALLYLTSTVAFHISMYNKRFVYFSSLKSFSGDNLFIDGFLILVWTWTRFRRCRLDSIAHLRF